MRYRLEHTEKVEQQVAVLEAKRSELALRLQEYETIGIAGGPAAMKRELNRLQQAEVDLRAEEGQLRSKLDAVLRESQNLSKNYEDTKKLATDTTLSKEKLSKLVNRLQKKMILVTRERDSYRQQLDLYEKEITVDGNNAMTERIPALERVIDGYKYIYLYILTYILQIFSYFMKKKIFTIFLGTWSANWKRIFKRLRLTPRRMNVIN